MKKILLRYINRVLDVLMGDGTAEPERVLINPVIVITHCYPTKENPHSGIWIHRAFSKLPNLRWVTKISKWGFLNPFNYIMSPRDMRIACFVVPAGFICFWSGLPYILYCIGQECFWIERYKWFAWFCRPIFWRATKVVYHSERVREAVSSAYNGAYDGQVIHTPVSAKEFYPTKDS